MTSASSRLRLLRSLGTPAIESGVRYAYEQMLAGEWGGYREYLGVRVGGVSFVNVRITNNAMFKLCVHELKRREHAANQP